MTPTLFGDDRVHTRDMLELGLIDDEIRRGLPGDLVERLGDPSTEE